MNFNEKMRYLRNKKGVSQEKASEKIGISISALRNYEKDRLAETDTLKRIQEYYKVPIEYLLNDNCINEEYNNIDIGESLKLSDTSIKNIKNVNLKTQNNVIDNFISNISENDFWKKLDECLKLQKELKELQPIKEIEKYEKTFQKYASNKSIFDYEIEADDIYSNSMEINYSAYYKENACTYEKEDKEIILKSIDILENNAILGEKIDNDNSLLDFKYDFSTISIKNFVNNNSKIPLEEIKTIINIPTLEFKERTDRIEILGFYISNELVRYIKDF